MPRAHSFRLTAAFGVVWLGAVTAGSVVMWNYANQAGPAGGPPARWPAETRMAREADGATLVMFVHPKCPCSRASVGELARLMAQGQGRARARVLFFKPAGVPDEWARTGLWQSAAAIPGVTVAADEGGVEARRFQAETSGHAVLYDARGNLRFSGGITPARGHAGDSVGRGAMLALWRHEPAAQTRAPVFGCSMVNPSRPNPSAP